MRTTHTFACLELSGEAYNEIADKLKAADYGHAFLEDGAIDMHGIGIVKAQPARDDRQLDMLEPTGAR